MGQDPPYSVKEMLLGLAMSLDVVNDMFTTSKHSRVMADYTRLFVPGGTYFFTLRLQDRNSQLLVDEIDLLRMSFAACKKRWPFHIDAAVILPNQLHMIWTLPPGDDDFPKRIRLIKTAFSKHIAPDPARTTSKLGKAEKGIWQRRYWEHLIRDSADLALHRHLIHSAPVQAGLVTNAADWPHGSFAKSNAPAQMQRKVGSAEILQRKSTNPPTPTALLH